MGVEEACFMSFECSARMKRVYCFRLARLSNSELRRVQPSHVALIFSLVASCKEVARWMPSRPQRAPSIFRHGPPPRASPKDATYRERYPRSLLELALCSVLPRGSSLRDQRPLRKHHCRLFACWINRNCGEPVANYSNGVSVSI